MASATAAWEVDLWGRVRNSVAAAQVVVYAGAVMVLYVFVVAYVGGQDEPLHTPGGALKRRVVVPRMNGLESTSPVRPCELDPM